MAALLTPRALSALLQKLAAAFSFPCEAGLATRSYSQGPHRGHPVATVTVEASHGAIASLSYCPSCDAAHYFLPTAPRQQDLTLEALTHEAVEDLFLLHALYAQERAQG